VSDYHYLRTLRAFAEADPGRVLLTTPTCDRTAAELLGDTYRLAGHLRSRGVREGQSVALMMHNRAEVVVGFLAALALGALPANVNPRYRPEEVTYVLRDCAAAALIYEPSLAAAAHGATEQLGHPIVTLETGSGEWRETMASPPIPPDREPQPADRLIIYTGGTTGMPRAVEWEVREHYQMIWQMVRHDRPPLDPRQLIDSGRRAPTALPCSPFLHGVGLALSLNTLNGGGRLVLTEDGSFNAAVVLGLAEKYDIAVLGIVGDAFARPLLLELETGRWAGRLGALRAISSSGAAWSAEVRDGIAAFLPEVTLVSNFGSTEALVTRDMGPNSAFHPDRDMVIVDERGCQVAPGTVGLLATSGHLPVGYFGQPERTAKTFPVIDGKRYAITGDEARLEPDGRIRVLGRGSSVINTGGEKVWPEEVEAVLRGHPDILDAVVVGRADTRWGQRVTAVLQWRPEAGASEEMLVALCKERLASYKCPKEWVALPVIPRTSLGKPDFPAIMAALDGR
jgi:fatty-acyl-CoA synthase